MAGGNNKQQSTKSSGGNGDENGDDDSNDDDDENEGAGMPSTSYVALLGRLSPSGIGVRMLPSSEKFYDLGLAFFRAGGGGQDMAATVCERRTMTRER